MRNPTFRSSVRGDLQPAREADEAGDVDYVAALGAGAREHVGTQVAAKREDGCEVDLQDFGPAVQGEQVGGVAALDASAGDEDGGVVVVGEYKGSERFDGRLGREVGGVDCALAFQGEDGIAGGGGCGVALGREGG